MLGNFYRKNKLSKHIANFGKNSMIIYLIHTFFTSFSRIILIKFNVQSFTLQIVIGTMMGLYIPLLCYYIINKVKFLNWCRLLFYPEIKRSKDGKKTI